MFSAKAFRRVISRAKYLIDFGEVEIRLSFDTN